MTRIENVSLPALVGVPAIAPVLASSFRPAGSLPRLRHLNCLTPPIVFSLSSYFLPTVAALSFLVVMATCAATLTLTSRSCVRPAALSVTVTLTV